MTAPRVTVVTGASSGIGRAVAHRAAELGDHLVLVARGEPPLWETALECETAGASSTTVLTADVGDDRQVASVVEDVVSRLGRIDAVINCAGVVAYGRTEEVPQEIFDGVLRTNLIGSVNVARHVIPVLRRQEAGSLVLIGSLIGHIAVPSMSPYVLSKWGVRALARQLQLENRDLRQVNIAYVAPGGIDTPIYEQSANYAGHVGRPPPPVANPERVAAVALRLVGRHRSRAQVGLANDVIRLGFSAMPWVFDVLIGPLFRAAATDQSHEIDPTPGNVLESNFAGNRLHGDRGQAVAGLARSLVTATRGVAGFVKDSVT